MASPTNHRLRSRTTSAPVVTRFDEEREGRPNPADRAVHDRPQASVEELAAELADDDRALWSTAFYAGLRRGELMALRWNDVDLDTNRISVSRSWDYAEGPIDPKSTKGTRRTPILSPLRRLLLEHKARTGRRDDELVFGQTASDPFLPKTVRLRALRAWAAANEKRAAAELPPLVPIGLHECRHSYVSVMHAAGVALDGRRLRRPLQSVHDVQVQAPARGPRGGRGRPLRRLPRTGACQGLSRP